ncbi:MAG: hypothetical protein JWR90_3195 [Marmoricola sp.]|nr:hypothetical protein [Marmoricola sp.]
MRQDTRVAATADIRRWLHVLRPVFLLGGFVVVWWCLATGTAQAAEGPHHDLGATTKVLGATADRVVGRAVPHAVAHRQHAAPVTQVVRHHLTPVRTTVRAAVLKPVTEAVRSKVAPVVRTTRAALSATPVTPVVEYVSPVASSDESAVLAGETPRSKAHANRLPHPSATSLTIPVEDPATTTPASSTPAAHDTHDAAVPTLPVGPNGDAPASLPCGATGSAAAQSGSGSGPGAAVCEAWTTTASPTTKTSIDAPAGRPTAGPAYQPSSSPD